MRKNSEVTQSEVFSQLRLPLIVLVTYAHSYGAIAPDYSLAVSGWDTYEVLKLLVSQTLVKVAVPVFYIMSGYLFFFGVERWSRGVYLAKMRRRFFSLLLPYFFWNALVAWKYGVFSWHVFWDFNAVAGVQTDWLGQQQLMTAPACMPLWFLRDLMVVSMLTPIIYMAVRRLGWWLMAGLLAWYLSGVSAFVPGLSAYAVCFFTLGAFMSIRHQELVPAMLRWERPACILAIVFGVLMMFTYRMPVFSSLMLCFRLSGALVVFCVAYRLLHLTRKRLPAVICRSSYLVYLAHYALFLSFIDAAFFRFFGTATTALCLHYLFCPLLKAALFVGAYCLYSRCVKKLTWK